MEVNQDQFKALVAAGILNARRALTAAAGELMGRKVAKQMSSPPRAKSRPQAGHQDTAKRYWALLETLRQDPEIPDGIRTEYHPFQDWGVRHRADIAWPDHRLAVEIDGGIFDGRAHGSIEGILRGMEKSNLYAAARWHCLRVTPGEVKSGIAHAIIAAWFRGACPPRLPRPKRRKKGRSRGA